MMKVFRKLKGLFHDDWCPSCAMQMDLKNKQLFMLNEIVGHYVQHRDVKYFKENLMKVNKKSDIPPWCVCLRNENLLVSTM